MNPLGILEGEIPLLRGPSAMAAVKNSFRHLPLHWLKGWAEYISVAAVPDVYHTTHEIVMREKLGD